MKKMFLLISAAAADFEIIFVKALWELPSRLLMNGNKESYLTSGLRFVETSWLSLTLVTIFLG
jgi:hypothetical protein